MKFEVGIREGLRRRCSIAHMLARFQLYCEDVGTDRGTYQLHGGGVVVEN